MNHKLPHTLWTDVDDYLSASRDSTGHCRNENPLYGFTTEENWLDYSDAFLDLPLWFSARVKPTFTNVVHGKAHEDWSYIVLSYDQILCLSPTHFDSWQLIVLLTRDTGGYKTEGPYVWPV